MTEMTNNMTLTCTLVPESLRTSITADLFGAYFPLQLEPFVFSMASRLSEDYSGGYWNFYQLGNGGFYMAPQLVACDGKGKRYQVVSLNGHEGMLAVTKSRGKMAADDVIGTVFDNSTASQGRA